MSDDKTSLKEVVASYLRKNPDFLDDYPDVLESLEINHQSGSAVSLIERQVEQLRASNGDMNKQLKRLTELTGVQFAKLANHNRNVGPQVSFDRPRLSPCLARLEDTGCAEYLEALAIIEAGREMLAQRPRADMPGFEACPTDQRRQRDYAMRQQVEISSRRAINEGRKLYDTDVQ